MKKIENISTLVFHHFHDGKKHKSSQGSITAQAFENFIKYLSSNYNLLSAEVWMEKFLSKELKDDDIAITFDDALLCQYDIALPILEKYNIKAFWFLYTSYLDGNIEKLEIYRYFRNNYFKSVEDFYKKFFDFMRSSKFKEKIESALTGVNTIEYLKEFPLYTNEDRIFRYIRDRILKESEYFELMDAMIESYEMNIDEMIKDLWVKEKEIKELSDLNHLIGLHSHTHPTDISKDSYEEQLKEYTLNLKKLESITAKKPISMSHPCGKYNQDTLKVLSELNIKVGFRADRKNLDTTKVYELPRTDHSLLTKQIEEIYKNEK